MVNRNEADRGSLSFEDRSLSKTAAGELLNTSPDGSLGTMIDTAVVRIKLAKTTKAEKATAAAFVRRSPSAAAYGSAPTKKADSFRWWSRKEPKPI